MAKHKHLQKAALLRLSVFGILFIVSIALTFIGLAANSQGAKQRYDTLIAVDQAGGDVETALDDLRGYIYSHMNTQIGSETGIKPPIQLKGTYDRLVAAEEARVTTANDALYGEAQADCERRQPTGFSGSNRLDCIAAYIDENGTQQKTIEDDFYKFDFVPPKWSIDLAGVSLLASIILGIVFVIDILQYLRTRNMVRLAR